MSDTVRVVRVVEPEIVRVAAGIPGPPGPPGPSGGGYVHTQSSPATMWTIVHNLGVRPSVAVMTSGGVEVDAEVVHMSLNETRIYFTAALSGFARLN